MAKKRNALELGQKLQIPASFFTDSGMLVSPESQIAVEVTSVENHDNEGWQKIGFRAEGTETTVYLKVRRNGDQVVAAPTHTWRIGLGDVTKYAGEAMED